MEDTLGAAVAEAVVDDDPKMLGEGLGERLGEGPTPTAVCFPQASSANPTSKASRLIVSWTHPMWLEFPGGPEAQSTIRRSSVTGPTGGLPVLPAAKRPRDDGIQYRLRREPAEPTRKRSPDGSE